jgi:hypothetical protein
MTRKNLGEGANCGRRRPGRGARIEEEEKKKIKEFVLLNPFNTGKILCRLWETAKGSCRASGNVHQKTLPRSGFAIDKIPARQIGLDRRQ